MHRWVTFYVGEQVKQESAGARTHMRTIFPLNVLRTELLAIYI